MDKLPVNYTLQVDSSSKAMTYVHWRAKMITENTS